MAKIPAVHVDITDDGDAYLVTATPWPTIESAGHPYTARLQHTRAVLDANGVPLDGQMYPTGWTAEKLAAFVKKLMATYPKASV